MITVVTTPGLATVQDGGRCGALRYGVGTAGAMDRLALEAGNLLLDNPAGAAGIEIPIFPVTFRFDAACCFAVTGADCAATVGERAVLPWSVERAGPGDELTFGLPSAGSGSRAYLLLPGGVDVPEVLGSRSTQIRGAFGGHEGRPLRAGDLLRAASPEHVVRPGLGLLPPALALPLQCDGLPAVRVLPAAEHDAFTPGSVADFYARAWKVSPQSDRYGYRLAGETMVFNRKLEMLSHGIVSGVIQVPPGGQPIIQMSDAQPSGGYPKLGTVIGADLWRLGQMPPGSRFRFVRTDWHEALAALAELDAWLAETRRAVALWRGWVGSAAA